MQDSNMESTPTNRSPWLVGSVGFVAGVATTLVVGALLMGGMMAMMGGGMMSGGMMGSGMMGDGVCNRPNTSQTPE